MICEFCKKSPATLTRLLAERTVTLCGTCVDRFDLQTAYENRILDIERLADGEDYEEAFAALDELRGMYASRDHDGWFETSLRSHEAMILDEHGRHEEALDQCRALAEKLAVDPIRFVSNQLFIAFILANRLNRPQEALDELEIGLIAASKAPAPEVLYLLTVYADIAQKHQWNVPLRHRDLLNATAHALGVEIPANLLSNPDSLASAILFAAKQKREGSVRYNALQKALRGSTDDVRAQLLRSYIEKESVGYFREIAEEMLNQSADLLPASEAPTKA